MRIDRWKHEGVNPDGTFEGKRGAVHAEAGTQLCPSTFTIVIGFGWQEDRTVAGATLFFDSEDEFNAFLEGTRITPEV